MAQEQDTDKVIANISQVADSLTEQVAQLRHFVTVLQQEYDPEHRQESDPHAR